MTVLAGRRVPVLSHDRVPTRWVIMTGLDRWVPDRLAPPRRG
jgi:hypothetical protein